MKTKQKFVNGKAMYLFSNKLWTMSENQSKYLHNLAYYITSNNAQSMYLLRVVIVTLNFTDYQKWLRIEFFIFFSLFKFVVGGVFRFLFN